VVRETFDHLVISRFNVNNMLDEAWLRSRIPLMEKFTAPSLAAQKVPFKWILLIDENTPQWVHDEIRRIDMQHPSLDIYLVNWKPKRGWYPDARKLMDPDADFFITTRIDTDGRTSS